MYTRSEITNARITKEIKRFQQKNLVAMRVMQQYFVDYYTNKENIAALTNLETTTVKAVEKLDEYNNVIYKPNGLPETTLEEIFNKNFPSEKDVRNKLESRLGIHLDLSFACHKTLQDGGFLWPVEPFDQVVEVVGDGKILPEGIKMDHLYQQGGCCGVITRHWIDYLANPERVGHQTTEGQNTFHDCFSPFLALQDNKGLHNYKGDEIKRIMQYGFLQRSGKILEPLFTSTTNDVDVSGTLRGDKATVMNFLNDNFPPDDGKKLYKLFQVVYNKGSSHIVAIARPFGDDEFHMFDPNIGWHVGDNFGCAAWMEVQFSKNMSLENEWGKIYMMTLEYTAKDEDAKKHYVKYQTQLQARNQARLQSIDIGKESNSDVDVAMKKLMRTVAKQERALSALRNEVRSQKQQARMVPSTNRAPMHRGKAAVNRAPRRHNNSPKNGEEIVYWV